MIVLSIWHSDAPQTGRMGFEVVVYNAVQSDHANAEDSETVDDDSAPHDGIFDCQAVPLGLAAVA